MAKSKIKKVEMSMVEPMDMPKYMSVDLEADELDALKDSKVGDELVLVIKGTLKSISQAKRMTDSGAEHTGTIQLEDFDVELGSNKIWSSLADDGNDA
jgi:hypothetical protein